VFRKNARQALLKLNKRDRRDIRRLTTPVSDPLAFYQAWEASRAQFQVVSGAQGAKTLINGFKKYFLLDEDKSGELLGVLTARRIQELKNEILDDLYEKGEHWARNRALVLLNKDDKAVREQWDAYIYAVLYSEVARKEHAVIYDAYAPLLRRLNQKYREAKQVRRFVNKTNRSLKKVQRNMASLEIRDNGILAALFALNINLVAVQAAHRKYEKAYEKLSKKDQQSAAKRLALYEKEVAAVKAQHLDSLPSAQSLRDIRKVASELDAVLLRIFDMDERSYNELMSRMKHYRELVRKHGELSRRLQEDAK
jgi:hypothetical protein